MEVLSLAQHGPEDMEIIDPTGSMEIGELSAAEIEEILEASMAAGVPQDGTPAYFDWASNHYAIMPDNIARGRFLVKLVRENLDWIGVDPNKGSIKVLDYGAGTGFFTQAFIPYVNQVLAIDDSRGMVAKYNSIAAVNNDKHSGCVVRAVHGDLIDRYTLRPALDPRITDTVGEYQSFDLVVMCQAIDSYITDASSSVQSMELVNALKTLVGRLKDDGVVVIVDIEKFYGDADLHNRASLDGRKEEGSGSREVVAALEEVEMEDIAVIDDEDFRVKFRLFENTHKRHYKYFMVRAKKIKGGED